MRGRKMSSANFVWPVHFARASTLRNGLPTTFVGLPFFDGWLDIQDENNMTSQQSLRSGRVACPRCLCSDPKGLSGGKPPFLTYEAIKLHSIAIDTFPGWFHLFPAHPRRRYFYRFVNLNIAV